MSLKLDKGATCLLIIDMQNGFCHEKGTLAKYLNIEPCKRIIPNVKSLIEICRKKGIPIVYVQQEHLPEDKNAVKRLHRIPPKPGSHLEQRSRGPACVKGTWDAEFVDELKPEPIDYIVKKQKYTAFYNTNLEVILRTLGVNTIILTGVNSNVCVESTARDAYFRDYDVIAVEEAIAAPVEQYELHKAALKNIDTLLGWVFPLKEVLKAIEDLA